MRRTRPRELRAFFSCMAWRTIPGRLELESVFKDAQLCPLRLWAEPEEIGVN